MSGSAKRAHEIARKIMKRNSFATMRDTREVYVFDPIRGVYCGWGDRMIEEEAEKSLRTESSIHLVNEIKDIVRRLTYQDRSAFDANNNVLVVGNGILNLETRELRPHTPDYLALRSIPVNYDPEADCPL